MSALHDVNFNRTSQTEKAKSTQVKNNAGGYTFAVSDKDRFRRFLTLGTEGGTYYVGERELTKNNVEFIRRYVDTAGVEAVNEIVAVSDGGLAPKNSYALFALAVAFTSDDLNVKEAAKAALPKVARITTHLFEFIQFVENTSGWGRGKRKAVANWYTDKSTDQLAFQVAKYRQRFGWTHRDAFRTAHPQGVDQNLGNYILGKEYNLESLPEVLRVFESLKAAKSESEVVRIIANNRMVTWEMVPTDYLKSDKVWRQLFENGMPQGALLRNTTRFARLGLFNDLKLVKQYADQLTDQEKIQRARIHPINYLNASVVYSEGQVDRSGAYSYYYTRKKNWDTNGKISAALDRGYQLAFKNIEPANKNTLVAVDVSGSMSAPASGLDMSCAQVSGAMAHMISKTEPYSMVRGFTSGSGGYGWRSNNSSMDGFIDLGLSESDSLPTVMNKVSNRNFGRTDCALPMMWALKSGTHIDTFIILTDNETWHGSIHPFEALKRYRRETGINAKLVVVAATATEFTIADPSDPGMLDISGFDSSGPKVIADFSAGRI